jgi:hypothetical protein
LGTAAMAGRFANSDLRSILDRQPSTTLRPRRAGPLTTTACNRAPEP